MSTLPIWAAAEGHDFYVPAFELRVNDQPLRHVHDVLSVTYTDSLTAIDSFEVTLNNPARGGAGLFADDAFTFLAQGTGRRFTYSDPESATDQGPLAPWTPTELRMGYYGGGAGTLRTMLTGQITTLSPNFPAGGGPTVTVRALNVLYKFRTKQLTRDYYGKTDTFIAEDLVKEIDAELQRSKAGVSVKLDTADIKANTGEPQNPHVAITNQFPIVFLMERARLLNYDLYVNEPDPGGPTQKILFHFRRSREVRSYVLVLEWGRSLLSFQPTLRTTNQVSKVIVRGWNPAKKEPVTGEATRADLTPRDGVLHPRDVFVTEPALAQEVTVDRPVRKKDEADRLAKNILLTQAQLMVTARGKTVGLPELRAGVKVRIEGVGTRFTGTYLLTDTTHAMGDGGYTTDFTARREADDPPRSAA